MRLIRGLFRRKLTSDGLVDRLKSKGISIGDGTYFFDPVSVRIDAQRPHMLKIGCNVKVTSGVRILCHDYSRSVLIGSHGINIGEADITSIGDNCFIGVDAIILIGSKIGSNCIIGAGSVVSGTYPSDCVIAGNPARIISSLNTFKEKRESCRTDAAYIYFKQYVLAHGRNPTEEEMGEAFAWLWMERERRIVDEKPWAFSQHGINRKAMIDSFLKTEPLFDGYKSFVDYCEDRIAQNQ